MESQLNDHFALLALAFSLGGFSTRTQKWRNGETLRLQNSLHSNPVLFVNVSQSKHREERMKTGINNEILK